MFGRQHPCCPNLDDCRKSNGREGRDGESGGEFDKPKE